MKKVVGYVRISQESQSDFNDNGQKEQIAEYCNRNNYDLIDVFVDEGKSDFNKESWQRFEEYLKANHTDIDFFVVTKYNRISRNHKELFSFIQKLAEQYKIQVISLEDPVEDLTKFEYL